MEPGTAATADAAAATAATADATVAANTDGAASAWHPQLEPFTSPACASAVI